ncbi:MAG: hypothetical protein K2W91_00850 [Novosphingobium sp.]|nr:hypothetical protein [Novosphingobium sp.]
MEIGFLNQGRPFYGRWLAGHLTGFPIRNNISSQFETHFLVPNERFVEWQDFPGAIKPMVGITKNYHIAGTAALCSTGNLPETLIDVLPDMPAMRCFRAFAVKLKGRRHDLAVPQKSQGEVE